MPSHVQFIEYTVLKIFFSVSNIIEEYEEQQEEAKNQARGARSKQGTPSKGGEFSGLLGSGTATNEMDFSFGGPVADEGGVCELDQNIISPQYRASISSIFSFTCKYQVIIVLQPRKMILSVSKYIPFTFAYYICQDCQK